MKRLLLLTTGLVAVAILAAVYLRNTNPLLTLSPEELRLRSTSPYYSGLPIGSSHLPPKEASRDIKAVTAYDVKRCSPKALSFGKAPAEVNAQKGERPTGRIPVVTFQILESGEVTNIALKQSSGIRDKDNLALDWVKGTRYNNRPGCGAIESEMGVTIDLVPSY